MADNRRIEELRMEGGVKERFEKKLVISKIKWAGREERMGDGKDSRCTENGEKRRRGRPAMRWHDCIKRDHEREKNGELEQTVKGIGYCW